jgi:hypothetical protein
MNFTRTLIAFCLIIANYNLVAEPLPLQPANSKSTPEAVLAPRLIAPSDTQPMSKPAYLYSVLPKNALAYIRLPNLWWLMGGVAVGNMFDQAVQSAPNAEALFAIRRGILDNLVLEIPQEWRELARFLLSNINAPVELAILSNSDDTVPLPMPELLLVTGLNRDNVQTASALLQTLAAKTPGIKFVKPLQADGSGALLIHDKSIEIYFHAEEQRLFLKIALPNPESQPLAKQIAALTAISDHSIYAATRDIDSTGQGILFWLNPKAVLNLADKFGVANELTILHAIGIADAKSITFGVGGSGGKQHLKLALDMPQTGMRRLLPIFNNDINFNATSELDTVLMLGLPDAAYLKELETNLKIWLSSDDYQTYQMQKMVMEKITGLTVDQLLNTFGSELLLLRDQAIYYFAVKLRDSNNFETLLAHLTQSFQLKYETKQLLNTTFHHLTVPSLIPTHLTDTATASSSINAMGFMQKLVNYPVHVYWIEREGYVVASNFPQVLMDILYATNKINVGTWLRQTQGLEPANSMFIISTVATGLPKFMYGAYLWSLSYLGDLVGNSIDLFSLPSTHELKLPNTGSYSVQLIAAPNQLAIEAVYESSPLEVLLSVGWETISTVGILAAIAIPNLDRSKTEETEQSISEISIEKIKDLQAKLITFHSIMGRFPDTSQTETILANILSPDELNIKLAPDTGSITVVVPNKCDNSGGELILTPILELNTIDWKCDGSLNTESIPSELCTQ